MRNQATDRRHSEIPDKLYFRIGEVAQLCGVEPYVLRFWESEFPQLKPNKGGTGQRLYRRRDVEMALRIKRLVHEQGYTIAGARQVLKDDAKQPPPQLPLPVAVEEKPVDRLRLRRMKAELEEIAAILARPVPGKAAHSPSQTPAMVRGSRTPAVMPPPAKQNLF